MQIQFQFSLAEIKEFQQANRKYGPERVSGVRHYSRLIACMMGFGLIIYLYCVPGFSKDNPPSTQHSDIENFLVFFAILLGIFFSFVLFSKHKRLKTLQAHINRIGPQTITITPELITITLSHSRLEHQWLAFNYFSESPNLYLLYLSSSSTLIIPKRAFASPAERDAFRVLAQAITPPSARAFPVIIPGEK